MLREGTGFPRGNHSPPRCVYSALPPLMVEIGLLMSSMRNAVMTPIFSGWRNSPARTPARQVDREAGTQKKTVSGMSVAPNFGGIETSALEPGFNVSCAVADHTPTNFEVGGAAALVSREF